MIECFREADSGDLFVVNGLDAPLRWDGLAPEMEEAGLAAPAAAISIAGSGTGPIIGTYYGHLRFLDKYGLVSNFSPISASYKPVGSTGTITNATNASPIVITSAGHGLSTGATVKIEGVTGNTSANNTWTITVLGADTFSLDDSHGTAAYIASGTWTSGVMTLTYTNVGVPVETKAVRRQILRNTDGQTDTFYVDVDTTDLSSTTFSTTRSDDDLSAQEAVPRLDSDGNLFANRHDKPSNFYAATVSHQGRMLFCVLVEYSAGHCKATAGSTTITGVGTNWQDTFAGREMHIDGANRVYTIDSVDEVSQTLTLTEPYESQTSPFLFYAIKPPPAYRRNIAYSESGLPQSCPPANGVSVPETGDELTGMLTFAPFAYIMERKRTHKLTFFLDPSNDQGIFEAVERGCVNNRCWIVVDASVFMLDELGVHQFTGARETQPVSEQIQWVFQSDDPVGETKINWQYREYFHAVLDQERHIIKWFVVMDGCARPRHALCYQYVLQRWWIEEYRFPIGGACVGRSNDVVSVFCGADHGRIMTPAAHLDTANADTGSVRGDVTSAGLFTLTDSAAAFSGVVNASVAIVHGKGKGQERRIVEATATTLRLDAPWLDLPDTTSTYQIGGIHFLYRSQWFRFADPRNEENAQRRFEFQFQPMKQDGLSDMRFRLDTAKEGETNDDGCEIQGVSVDYADRNGVESVKGEADLSVDMTHESGLVDVQLPGGKEYYTHGRRYTQFDIEGWTNEDRARLYQFLYEGALPPPGLGAQEGQ